MTRQLVNVADSFQNIVAPLYRKIKDGRIESEELTKLRDWLLPMLMNDQVTVTTDE